MSSPQQQQQPWFTVPSRRSRPTQSSYMPPHLRSQPNNIDQVAKKFDQLDVSEKTEKSELSDETPVEVTGDDIPPPVTSFAEMGFAENGLMENIRKCGYVKPTPIQKYAVPVAMAGRDLMASAQTGSGKTAAFCFPIISRILGDKKRNESTAFSNGNHRSFVGLPTALILAPTRELASQIHDEAKKFSNMTGIKVVVAYGGAPIVPQLRSLERGVDILVATPGRLVDMIERGKVSLRNVKYLTLDEADRMLDMGFEKQVRKIVQEMEMPPPGKRQTMLFSATFPDEIQKLASDFLVNYIFLAAGKVGSSTGLIDQKVELVTDMDKRQQLLKLLSSQRSLQPNAKDALTLVFVETKRGANELEGWLCRQGFPSTAIHGDKIQMERERALRLFRSGRTPIMVATDVASRGLDIPHVAHVINFDLPRAIDDYVHRIGRTGRAGKSGLATAFFSDKNAPIAKALVELMQGASQEVPAWLTDYANNYTGGESNRYSRNGDRKFAAYDYRNGGSSDYGYGGGSPDFGYGGGFPSQPADPATYAAPYANTCGEQYVAATGPVTYAFPYQPYAADYSVAPPTDYSVVPPTTDSYGNGYDYGSVTATGWD